MKLSTLSRVRLATLPTPFQELPNLTKALGGPRIFVKRDDMTGLALGGNKTRKLEFLMGEAVKAKADTIVTYAGFHSNWCTQTAAAACRLGMKTVLFKSAPRAGYDPEEYDGNQLLHFLAGAEIITVRPDEAQAAQDEKMKELKKKGRRPYLLTATGSTPPGVAGYITCMLELFSQAVEMGIGIDYLVHASGSGGTQAGLILGAKAFQTNIRVIGSTTGSRTRENQVENVTCLIQESQKLLESNLKIGEEDIVVHDQYAGAGYGFMTEGKAEAVRLMAQTEGIFLDPVYTASGMACLIDLCRKKFFKKNEVVAFLHTGGQAALFPYKVPLRDYGQGRTPAWTIPPWSPAAH
ncbi:MAG TPA: D-cysteine desulfhydrase family protein [Thermodesulfobacteriota bacterium]|nr:D-cysteine desulfhydrase family protein [Thermodesulfobacteriota bacterium]